ncbi:hypothetical protein [Pseudaminobacter salicylatoxidans]|uniref:hypothetical protein n=1 Tax=Pseudaminobacter salicylatoxidans TaxID=93369 RepID=UPI0002E9F315|nr:hypothetical protein [Pseudaminobacter salicylatoxidans]
MARLRKRSGWFAALRRDRLLFAIAASLVLLAHVFQPLAEARAASRADGLVICTMLGMRTVVPDGKLPPAGTTDKCPTCIGGPCAGMVAPLKVVDVFEKAFAAPVTLCDAGVFPAEIRIPPDRLSEPPPAIRAPPSFLS